MATDSQNWFYRDFARTAPVQGPFTLGELAERAQTGELAYNVLVRCGDGEWLQADRVTELIQALRQRRVPYSETGVMPIPRELVQAHRRRLNWVTLFVVSILFTILCGVLIAAGSMDSRNVPLSLAGQLVCAVAGVIFSCAVIRWAINPLFAQMVDTNDHLAQIAMLLKKQDERKE